MNQTRMRWGGIVLAAGLVLGAVVMLNQSKTVGGAEPAKAASHRFSVVETEGHNLIVTDNESNTLYFYTVDKGEPVGSDLKLRGKLDLNQIGKATLKPVAINIQK